MNERYVLALDPSGNFYEGKGTTGWCLFDQDSNKVAKFGYIYAENFTEVIHNNVLGAVDALRAKYSRLETPQLIGVIKYEAAKRGLSVSTQTAMQVKTRWSDKVLEHKGYIVKKSKRTYIGTTGIPDHVTDSVRHALHFTTYTSKYRR